MSSLVRYGLLWMLFAAPGFAPFASEISIREAGISTVNGIVMLDATAELELSNDAIDALSSGIALFFELEIRINRARKYLWDRELYNTERRFSIQRHALSEQFVVNDLVTAERRVHDSLDAAIEDLGRVRELPVVDSADLELEPNRFFAIRMRLDLESLPAPMVPLAYLTPSWHMSSGWYQWPIAR